MRYRKLAVGCFVTLLVAGVTAATESAKAPAASVKATQAATPPATGATTSTATKPPPSPNAKPDAKPAKPEKKVDLNNASLAELQTLPTVTEADAKKIIANRPYKSKGELVTKAGLPEGVYQAVRRKVELQKPRTSAPKK